LNILSGPGLFVVMVRQYSWLPHAPELYYS
jgi:hypothetical protein